MKTKAASLSAKICVLFFAGSLFLSAPVLASVHERNTEALPSVDAKEKGGKKEKLKKISSKKNRAVKIYKETEKQNIHVFTKKKDRNRISFFVFDLEGTLVQNYQLKGNEHKKITGMKKGTYIYRVFCGDEETAAGKIEIK